MRIATAFCVGLVMACTGEGGPPPARVGTQPRPRQDQALLDANRVLAQREERDITDWIARQGMSMLSTGTGLHLKLVRDLPGPVAKPDQLALIDFKVYLIDGTLCYGSDGVPQAVRVEQENVESGLHEGLQYMSVGDSAVLAIPSHLAHGLAGDMKKIPMRSTVIYHLALKALR
jgi:FKBP-type peptidyl-prolyl cis-trans isomerase